MRDEGALTVGELVALPLPRLLGRLEASGEPFAERDLADPSTAERGPCDDRPAGKPEYGRSCATTRVASAPYSRPRLK
jgi:hypothetical protein